MYLDTAAGFVSGSLCLLEVKWGGWGAIRALITEGGISPDPRLCYAMKFSNITPDVIQCGIHTGCLSSWVDLVYPLPWSGEVPALLVCLFPLSGAGKPSVKGICGCPPRRESIWGAQTSSAWLIEKKKCIDDSLSWSHAPKPPIFGQEHPLLPWCLPLFQRELKQMTVSFFPSRGKCWLNWILRAKVSAPRAKGVSHSTYPRY